MMFKNRGRYYMTLLGYWASQEQYSMQNLLEFVVEAEKGGFTSVLTSDHFHPWWHDNGFGNFTWVWLAAAAEMYQENEIYYRRNSRSLPL